MNTPHRACRRAAGFTMIEMLLVLLLMSILLILVMPSFLNSIQRQKILGIAQQTAILMRLARLQAIKTGINSVVQIDTAKGTVTGFTDSNGNLAFDSATEKMFGQVLLSKGVSFMAVDGFTSPPTPAVAVFKSDGMVLCPTSFTTPCSASPGAFRFQNVRGDQIEARVMMPTTGRIQLQKNISGTWLPNTGGNVWKWN